MAADVGAGPQFHVGTGEGGELADPQAGLDGDEKQGTVAPAHPGGAVGSGQQRVDLGSGEERDELAVGALVRDGQHPLDELGVLGVAQRCVGEQRVHGGQPRVAGLHAVVALDFEVLQEGADQGGVEVLE